MRVITGSCRGKKLKTLESLDTRPTTDMVKEAVEIVVEEILRFAQPRTVIVDNSSTSMAITKKLHAQAIAAVQVGQARDEDERKSRAFTMTAELMLMQHTCHWFCKSRTVASVRLMARHKCRYEQVLQSVAPQTLYAYKKLLKAA